jgi:uncharacterized protein (TIGR00725 family)
MASTQVAVCGPAECTEAEYTAAVEVGRLLAERGAVVICGGGEGVMSAVARGASAGGGFVLGIRPDRTQVSTSAYLTATVVTDTARYPGRVDPWVGVGTLPEHDDRG